MTNNKIRVLIVDDDDNFRKMFANAFAETGFTVFGAENAAQAIETLRKNSCDVAVIDVALPDMDGMSLLQNLKEQGSDTEIIILTGQGTVETAALAIKLGAFDYLQKPFSIIKLEEKIVQAYKRKSLRNQPPPQTEKSLPDPSRPQRLELIGNSARMAALRSMIAKIADSESSVIIQGESGVGKDVVANMIYQKSKRRDAAFIAINCGALPENLLENELFGHEKGAFTDASTAKRGLFEVAHNGTLFIDEIGEMSPSLQVKFLRVLENGEFRRLGGTEIIKTNVRIIAATNKDLRQMMEEDKFRKDLYYRLNIFSLRLPPLREHWEDIPFLVEHFLESPRAAKVCPIRKTVNFESMQRLVVYPWPGNVRELFNILERALVLSSGPIITPNALPLEILAGSQSRSEEPAAQEFLTLADMEKNHVKRTLDKFRYNKSKAAEALGISRQRLYRMIRDHQLE